MAFRMTIQIEMDTSDEVVDILNRLGASHLARTSIRRVKAPAIREDWGRTQVTMLGDFLTKRPRQRAILMALLNGREDGLYKAELLRNIGMATGKELAGALSGLNKLAKKLGYAPSSLYRIESVQWNGERTNRYMLGDSFRTEFQAYLDSNHRRLMMGPNGHSGGVEAGDGNNLSD